MDWRNIGSTRKRGKKGEKSDSISSSKRLRLPLARAWGTSTSPISNSGKRKTTEGFSLSRCAPVTAVEINSHRDFLNRLKLALSITGTASPLARFNTHVSNQSPARLLKIQTWGEANQFSIQLRLTKSLVRQAERRIDRCDSGI